MSQEIRHCLDSSLQKLSMGLPRDMSRKWVRKESITATHKCTCKHYKGSDWGYLGKLLRTQSQSSMLQQTVVFLGMNFQCPLLFLGKKELRNELLIAFSQTRMDDKGFSSYKWKLVLARPSTWRRLSSSSLTYEWWSKQQITSLKQLMYEWWSKQQIPSSKQFPREEKRDKLTKWVHTFWNRSNGKLLH